VGISPFLTNTLIDSCAFDPKYEPETSAARRLFELSEKHALPLLIAHSTLKEVEHPNTPKWVKHEAQSRIFTVNVQRTEEEDSLIAKIESVLAGNGKVENIKQDARHVFEAQKYGSYFITTDNRILARSTTLADLCPIQVLRPSEFLNLVEDHLKDV
jgi:hypothetical protein